MSSKSKGTLMNSVKRSLTRRIGSNPVKMSLDSLRSKLRENQETRKREQAIAEQKALDMALSNARARQVAHNIMSRRGSKSVTRGKPQAVENTKHRSNQSQRNNPTKLAPGWRSSRMTNNVAKKLGVPAMHVIPFSDFQRLSRKGRAAYLSQYASYDKPLYPGKNNTAL